MQEVNIQPASFEQIGKTGMIMFPLSLGEQETKGDKLLGYKSRGYSPFFWNILFYDSGTKETRLLSERKMLISNIHSYNEDIPDPDADTSGKWIFYSIRVDDVNKDNVLSVKDPEYLFVSDLGGQGFRQISPTGLHVRSWNRIKGSSKLMMLVARDTDKDGEYTPTDDGFMYVIDLKTQTGPEEVLSPAMKAKINALFNKDWKNKEQ